LHNICKPHRTSPVLKDLVHRKLRRCTQHHPTNRPPTGVIRLKEVQLMVMWSLGLGCALLTPDTWERFVETLGQGFTPGESL
jgi:hypothetical protein